MCWVHSLCIVWSRGAFGDCRAGEGWRPVWLLRGVEKGHLVGCVQVFSGTEGRVRIEKRADTNSFVIENAERADQGHYTIKVTNPVGEDMASIFLQVVGEQRGARGLSQGVVPRGHEVPSDHPASPSPDVPDPPEAVRVTSVGEDWATLVWEPPKYDGGQPVTGECPCATVLMTSDLPCPLTSP